MQTVVAATYNFKFENVQGAILIISVLSLSHAFDGRDQLISGVEEELLGLTLLFLHNFHDLLIIHFLDFPFYSLFLMIACLN